MGGDIAIQPSTDTDTHLSSEVEPLGLITLSELL